MTKSADAAVALPVELEVSCRTVLQGETLMHVVVAPVVVVPNAAALDLAIYAPFHVVIAAPLDVAVAAGLEVVVAAGLEVVVAAELAVET